MSSVIILFGAATMAAGVIIAINPESVYGLIRKHFESMGMHVLAVVVRVILGVALVMCAAESKYPTAIEVIGWISLVAALVMGIMGRTNFKRLIAWALGIPSSFRRIGGLLAGLFGCFLVYAVI